MQRKLLMKGKVKEAYDLGDRLEFRFTDNISVFDKVIPSQIPFKGETLSREGMYWFGRAEKMGIKTHFLEYLPPAGMLCKKVDILQPGQITSKSKNYLIPLEWICRWYVAGSLYDRVLEGKVSARDLGFPSGHTVLSGERLPEPFIEVSTKLEKTDRLLRKDEALQISGLSADEYEQAREIVLKIDGDIDRSVSARGLIHVDGKKELAFDEERCIMVIEQPEGIAGVIPMIFSLTLASSRSVFPKTSWKSGGSALLWLQTSRSPVSGSNLPGACHTVTDFSAGSYPFPF